MSGTCTMCAKLNALAVVEVPKTPAISVGMHQ